ncbi:hypothetical protein P43SY_007889 [Pythium insidiosum]|uniref:Uncharacterized protein n=1 Tax=Pythium insidiosum TaxID=114742 RepID=A0AAD5MB68_PYTIN|nr:hypothetical protein P43SY_007889 [Pythium insidiosum]
MESTPSPLVRRLPLHPRKAQELFAALLQIDGGDGSDTVSQSLAERTRALQRRHAIAVSDAKRGHWFGRPEASEALVFVKLSADGAAILVSDASGYEDDESEEQNGPAHAPDGAIAVAVAIAVASVLRVRLLDDTDRFAIEWSAAVTKEPAAQDDDDKLVATQTMVLEAESHEALGSWLVALTCAVMATREATQPPRSQWERLLLQAIRLRVVELSDCLGIRAAVARVTQAYDRMRQRELEYDLPAFAALFLLQA